MPHVVDIDKELADLWIRVYTELRAILRNESSPDSPYTNESFPKYIVSVYVDEEGVIVVKDVNGSNKLIEEYPDEVMYSVYQSLVKKMGVYSPTHRRRITSSTIDLP